jgi:hypothetical protein
MTALFATLSSRSTPNETFHRIAQKTGFPVNFALENFNNLGNDYYE